MAISIGSTSVNLDMDTWEKHGRMRAEVRILCVDNPFSDYDALRSEPTLSDVEEALDWIIENEGQEKMRNYTAEQAKNLHAELVKLLKGY